MNLKKIIIGLTLIYGIQTTAVLANNSQPNNPAKAKRSDIKELCRIRMKVPSGLQILVVEQHNTYPDERCILGVIERGRKIDLTGSPSSVSEYYNFVHFVLTVKNIPVTQRLMEYRFSTTGNSDGAVKYIGQPKSEIATQMGYLGETTDSWSITSQGGGTLYAAEVSSFRSIFNRSPVRYHRMHLLWGNEKVSVGAIVVCTPSKPRDCKLQDNIREMFGTISDVDDQ